MKSSDFPQLALMRAGVEYQFEISVRNFKVKVRPLSNLEIVQATQEAHAAFEKTPPERRVHIALSLYHAMYQLERAATDDVGATVSQLPLSLMQMMHNEEINTLWKQYVRVLDKVNPSFEEFPAEDLQNIVDELKKNSDPKSLLTDLSISKLIAVCCHLLKAPLT